MRASPANPRKRSRAPELVNSNNKLSEDGPPTKQRATSKLSRGSMKLGQKSRLSQQASRLSRSTSGLAEHLEAIKGSRIGVWWSNDKCYYKVLLFSYSMVLVHRSIHQQEHLTWIWPLTQIRYSNCLKCTSMSNQEISQGDVCAVKPFTFHCLIVSHTPLPLRKSRSLIKWCGQSALCAHCILTG